VIWAWGYRTDDSLLRIIGIAALLVAFLLRFVDRQKRSPTTEDKEPPTP
jgi:hypothetical protein